MQSSTSLSDKLENSNIEQELSSSLSLVGVELKRIEYEHKLLDRGIHEGARAVRGVFITFAGVFLISLASHHLSQNPFMSAQQILIFAAISFVMLVMYFGFIFGFSLYLSADFRKKLISVGSKRDD